MPVLAAVILYAGENDHFLVTRKTLGHVFRIIWGKKRKQLKSFPSLMNVGTCTQVFVTLPYANIE